MTKTVIIIICIILVFPVLLFFLGIKSRLGEAPGMVDGQLKPCPSKPNCVCSEYPGDRGHYVEPFSMPDANFEDPADMIKIAVTESGGIITAEASGYISAEYSSRIFGFRDDTEFRIDGENGLIHIRSASRLGYSDMGVNEKRVEQVKDSILKKVPGR